MQVCCPHCQTPIDCETLQLSETVRTCPQCHAEIDLPEIVHDISLSLSGVSLNDRTRTVQWGWEELQAGDRIGKFDIVECVGRGGFGHVYKAYDRRLQRVVALKIPRGDVQLDGEAFVREAQLAASVRDPNIVGVHEIGQDGEQVYICSEFIDGTTLKEWLRREERSIPEICQLLIRIARSLHTAHLAGLVHRDLKPANILIDEEGHPYITDFGLARKWEADASEALSRTGEIVGTPAYMAPEQARGEISAITPRTDIYSLGVILYEAASGRRPFGGEIATIIHSILDADPVPPSQVDSRFPAVLEAIILKAMSGEAGHRYATAADLADDLERFLSQEPTIALPPKGLGWLAYRLRKNAWPLAISGAFLLVVGLTIWIAGGEGPGPRPVVNSDEAPPRVEVVIQTIPPRANVAIVPIDPYSRRPLRDKRIQPDGLTPVEVELPAGDYIVEAFLPGWGLSEVRRTVSQQAVEEGNGSELEPISIHPLATGLAEVTGGEFEVSYDAADMQRQIYRVDDFLVQTTEVTCRQYREIMGQLPEAFAALNRSRYDDRHPITRFTLPEARAYAERVGMRLIDFEEYVYLATNKGTTGVPWGEGIRRQDVSDCWKIGEVGGWETDQTLGTTASLPVRGLFSNVPELTGTTLVSERLTEMGVKGQQDSITIVGQPISLMPENQSPPELPLSARQMGRKSIETFFSLDYPIGFRCVRSKQPRFLDESRIGNSRVDNEDSAK